MIRTGNINAIKISTDLRFKIETAQIRMDLGAWISVRNSLLTFLRDNYDLNNDAIMELRRLAGLKNGMTKGYSQNKATQKMMAWSSQFTEEYNYRLKNYDEYNLRTRKGKTESTDWKYEGYMDRISYAQELTRDLIKIMKMIMEFEYMIVDYVCSE